MKQQLSTPASRQSNYRWSGGKCRGEGQCASGPLCERMEVQSHVRGSGIGSHYHGQSSPLRRASLRDARVRSKTAEETYPAAEHDEAALLGPCGLCSEADPYFEPMHEDPRCSPCSLSCPFPERPSEDTTSEPTTREVMLRKLMALRVVYGTRPPKTVAGTAASSGKCFFL